MKLRVVYLPQCQCHHPLLSMLPQAGWSTMDLPDGSTGFADQLTETRRAVCGLCGAPALVLAELIWEANEQVMSASGLEYQGIAQKLEDCIPKSINFLRGRLQ